MNYHYLNESFVVNKTLIDEFSFSKLRFYTHRAKLGDTFLCLLLFNIDLAFVIHDTSFTWTGSRKVETELRRWEVDRRDFTGTRYNEIWRESRVQRYELIRNIASWVQSFFRFQKLSPFPPGLIQTNFLIRRNEKRT